MQTMPKIVVLIPCLNEEMTIGKVLQDFRKELPDAEFVVFDNNCTDRTARIAEEAGARVIQERRPGKGYVVASMFKKIEADYYIMVDGDDTYSSEHVHLLLQPLLEGKADMVVATRLAEYSAESFRPLHVFGNNLVRSLVNWIFQSRLTDILSGYRGFTREVVKTLPILSSGFEVETELTIRTLDYQFTIQEVPVPYRERPEGSFSKLHTFRDGYRVLLKIFNITKGYKPFAFFGGIGLIGILLSIGMGAEVISDFLEDHYVNKVPTAILASACMLLGLGSLGIGIILHTLNDRFKEVIRVLQNR